ncbi:MAG: FAD-dependent thymidylate synthase [Deltaproteobacteria bacterium]|nr:FAD-dependent thymidylate synthase [Deltaproteobacteria bacterium]
MAQTLQKFFSVEPEIRLEKSFTTPFKNFIAAARTCYSGKGVVRDDEPFPRTEELAKSLYRAGHHTTLQHAHFEFSMSNISRQFIWSFLHSHPFYNSEQVSQRYVPIKTGLYAIPPLQGQALEIYTQTAECQMRAYHELTERLIPIVESEYAKRFSRERESFHKEVKKKAQEVARYAVPVATFAHLYHTVSGITLLRYWRLCQQLDTPMEQQIVVGKMIDELLKIDPMYKTILEEPIPLEETPEYPFFKERSNGPASTSRPFLEEFDRGLGGRVSKLTGWKSNNEQLVADAVREVLGRPASSLDNATAIRWALDPRQNKLLGENLNLTTLSKISRSLFHASYTFQKKLSHTADSQDQRHRMTPASRPCLEAHWTEEPDYITPALIQIEDKILKEYQEVMERSWENMGELKKRGVPMEFVLYLLPNAAAIRFTESSDLLNLHHKHAMRLCFNAQEEIWRASLDEAEQIAKIEPIIGNYLLPPCGHRHLAGIRPKCPEGEHFCGIPVWKLPLSQFQRVI